MLASARNADLYAEWLKYIEAQETRDAFVYLVGLSACLREWACHPERKGEVRDFRFMHGGTEQPFAFIVNKKSLLFYFRAPATRSGRYRFEELQAAFEETKQVRDEWTVRLVSIADVQRLWRFLSLV